MEHQIVRVFPDLAALSRAAAEEFIACARDAVLRQGRFACALSGGRTPAMLHGLLAGEFRERVDWHKVHLFFGDERYVDPTDPRSNFGMARETLLKQVAVPPEQVYPMPTDAADPDVAAHTYEATLRTCFGEVVPVFDLILLGMGPDGHTASLFPGTPAPQERERLVVPVRANAEPPLRLTLTLPVLTAARQTLFLVTGADKRPVWQAIKADMTIAARQYPAARVAAEARQAAWFIDRTLEEG